jgi:hypothetical protein
MFSLALVMVVSGYRNQLASATGESGGAKVGHGSGGIVSLRAA